MIDRLRARISYVLLNCRILPWNWVWVGRWARKHDKEEPALSDTEISCPRCGGSGETVAYPVCPRCDGDGVVDETPEDAKMADAWMAGMRRLMGLGDKEER